MMGVSSEKKMSFLASVGCSEIGRPVLLNTDDQQQKYTLITTFSLVFHSILKNVCMCEQREEFKYFLFSPNIF